MFCEMIDTPHLELGSHFGKCVYSGRSPFAVSRIFVWANLRAFCLVGWLLFLQHIVFCVL